MGDILSPERDLTKIWMGSSYCDEVEDVEEALERMITVLVV